MEVRKQEGRQKTNKQIIKGELHDSIMNNIGNSRSMLNRISIDKNRINLLSSINKNI
jgi:hypothetical protein